MRKTLLLPMTAMLLALASCQNVKQELGVGRHSPDEFAVVKRAPLTLPPVYDLRAPADGSAPPAADAANRARTIVLGASEQPVPKGSAESALLGKMNASAADPDIRQTLDRENGILAVESRTVAEKLIFWKDEEEAAAAADAKAPASIVDPKAEAERIKKNKETGKPVTEGDVPVIEKKKGTIDKIF